MEDIPADMPETTGHASASDGSMTSFLSDTQPTGRTRAGQRNPETPLTYEARLAAGGDEGPCIRRDEEELLDEA